MARLGRRSVRTVLVLLVALAAGGLAAHRIGVDTTGALRLLRGSGVRNAWVGAALLLSLSSLVVYGELHRRLLVVAGARLPGRTVQAVTVAGNAVSLTLPTVGTALGPAYAVRALVRRGVTTMAAAWSVGAAAVVTAVVLAALAPLGLAAGGVLSAVAGTTLSAALVAAVVVLAALLRPRADRHPAAAPVDGARLRPVRAAIARAYAWAAVHRPSPGETVVVVVLAALTWALDIGALALCAGATRAPFTAGAVLVGYLAVQGSIAIRLTPGGAGLAEAGLLAALVTAGMPAAAATVTVALYRAVSWLAPAAVGWVVVLVLSEGVAGPAGASGDDVARHERPLRGEGRSRDHGPPRR